MSKGGDFVTVRLGDQLLGLPVLRVHDVIKLKALTRVPGAPAMVAGVMNLRGRIVTVIDMRARLGLPPGTDRPMCTVIEHGGQSYALVVDAVGDVVSVPDDSREGIPATLSPAWRAVAAGVYRLDELMVAIDIDALFGSDAAAA